MLILFFVLASLGQAAPPAETPLDGHSYELIYADPPLTWVRAQDSAKSLGGYLATITDPDEQALIGALLSEGDSAWIGGSDVVVESTWIWWTGEAFDYTNWAPGEPDDADKQDFLMLSKAGDLLWHDENGAADAFVVEWDCCRGQRTGNIDCDQGNQVNILDVARLIDHLFISGEALCCPDEANTNGDSSFNVDLLDVVKLIDHLYQSRAATASCPSTGSGHPDDSLIITDVTGMEWNVTNPVNFYGMDTTDFNFALGPGGHPGINDPEFHKPGDSGYPIPGETFSVIGVTINGQSRAYPIPIMHYHEICNDSFDSVHVSIAY